MILVEKSRENGEIDRMIHNNKRDIENLDVELERMETKPNELDITDIEGLHYLADYVLFILKTSGYVFDEEGDNIVEYHIHQGGEYSDLKMEEIWESHIEHRKESYLNFEENEELHKLSFSDACNLSFEEIKEKYLSDILQKARNIMRKGTLHPFDVPSPKITDEYLDNLLALCWKENLKLWAIRWDENFQMKSKL